MLSPSPPGLLHVPTGSGKTFVIGQALAQVSTRRDVLWFWCVLFVTQVQQTEEALCANATGLVVDEAHIGPNKGTEFGKFAHCLAADYLVAKPDKFTSNQPQALIQKALSATLVVVSYWQA